MSRNDDEEIVILLIENLFQDLIKNLSEGKHPVFENHMYDKDAHRIKLQSFKNSNSRRKMTLMIHLLSKIYENLQDRVVVTIRDLYYEDWALYGNQTCVNDLVQSICSILQVERRALNIEATSKGLIAGEIILESSKKELVNVSLIKRGLLIPSRNEEFQKLQSNAKFALLIEKDAIFQRLLDEKFLEKCKVGTGIIITGKGYPDFSTRMILRKITQELKIPAFALVDCDPHGLEIVTIVKWGSKAQGKIYANNSTNFTNLISPDIEWIGLLPSDIKKYNLEGSSGQLSQNEFNKIADLEKLFDKLENVPENWKNELKEMKRVGQKIELEALVYSESGAQFLIAYLNKKLQDAFLPAKNVKNSQIILSCLTNGDLDFLLEKD